MVPAITFLTSTVVTFFVHRLGERYFTKNNTKQVRIIIKGYQVHHSAFGFLAILLAVIFAGSYLMFIFFGYGIGNIWQHKRTHNRLGERGMVFVSKILR